MRFLLDKILAFWYPSKTPISEYKPHMVTTPRGKRVNVGGCILKKDDPLDGWNHEDVCENHKDSGSTRYH